MHFQTSVFGYNKNEANYLKCNQIINFPFICNHVISCASYFGMCDFHVVKIKKDNTNHEKH